MTEASQWFVLRDLSRPNALVSAYMRLTGEGIRCFTPLVKKRVTVGGRPVWRDVPYIRDLLFAYATRAALDPLTAPGRRLQYRYVRGGYKEPMTVRNAEMERFIRAVSSSPSARYYSPEEFWFIRNLE